MSDKLFEYLIWEKKKPIAFRIFAMGFLSINANVNLHTGNTSRTG